MLSRIVLTDLSRIWGRLYWITESFILRALACRVYGFYVYATKRPKTWFDAIAVHLKDFSRRFFKDFVWLKKGNYLKPVCLRPLRFPSLIKRYWEWKNSARCGMCSKYTIQRSRRALAFVLASQESYNNMFHSFWLLEKTLSTSAHCGWTVGNLVVGFICGT